MVISILRQECNKADCRIAEICAPEGLRKRGRPKTTWRRKLVKGKNETRLKWWNQAEATWHTYVLKCMGWRKWRFELDTESGLFETGAFGENRQRAGDIQNVANVQIGCQK